MPQQHAVGSPSGPVGGARGTALYFERDANQAYAGTMALNGRILIVEDDISVRTMLAEYLGTHGYEIAQADRGTAMREAVELLAQKVADLRRGGELGLQPGVA